MKKSINYLLAVFLFVWPTPGIAQKVSEIDSLENVLASAKEDTLKVNTLNLLGRKLYKTDGLAKAMQFTDEALLLSQNLHYKKGIAESYNISGIIKRLQGNYPEAIENMNRALKIYREMNDKAGIAVCYNNLGIAYKNQGNYDEALKCYKSSLKLKEASGDKKGIATSYSNISNVLLNKGEYDEALKHSYSALKILDEIDDKGNINDVYNNIGIIYKNQRNYPEAMKMFNLIIESGELARSKSMAANVYTNVGIICKHQENYDEALKNYLLALKFGEESGDKQSVAKSYSNIAIIYNIKGDYEESLKNHLVSISIMEEIGDKRGIGASCNNIGLLFFAQDKYDEARIYYNRGIKLAEEIGHKPLLRELYNSLSKVDSSQAFSAATPLEKKAGYWKSAYDNFKQYAAIDDSIFSTESNNQIAQMKALYETEKKDKEIVQLNSENEIKALEVKRQQASLLAAMLERDKKQNEITLLNQSNEIQELQLKKQKEELAKKYLESVVGENQLKLVDNEKKLQVAEVDRQKLMKNSQAIAFLLIVLSGFFALYRFRQVQHKKQETERTRISRDLHDDIGATLSSISIFSAAANQKLKNNNTEEAGNLINRISEDSREMVSVMSDFVWTLNPENDSIQKVTDRMQSFASPVLSAKDIRMNFEADESLHSLSIKPDVRKNFFLIFKEAVNNAAKYSEATEMNIHLKQEDTKLVMAIRDNGKGFVMPHSSGNGINGIGGNGIKNMHARAKEIKAGVKITSDETGTVIVVVANPQSEFSSP